MPHHTKSDDKRRWRDGALRAGLFFSLLLLPLVCGECFIRRQPNASKAKHEYLLHHSREVDVLVLGSSHTYYGIAPELLSPKAYSAAQVSQTLRYDEYLLHHYPFDHLKWVIMPISDFSLYEELEDGASWYLASRYRIYMDCDIHSRLSVYGWEMTAFRSYCSKLRQLWEKPHMQWSQWGQGLEYTVENKPTDWDNGEKRAAQNAYTDFSHAPEAMAHLESISRFCRAHHARMLLVSTPLRESYRQHQRADQRADTELHISRFLLQHPQCRYLDFSQDTTFTADDFYDSDHLTTRGADKLTRKIRVAMTE